MQTMLRTWSEIKGRSLRAVDGPCGRVDDVLFDDRDGAVRHVVVALGRWPLRRRVLLDPQWISSRGEGSKALCAAMTREEIERAPALDAHPPVSRQHEMEAEESLALASSYSGASSWGVLGIPPLPSAEVSKISLEEEARREVEREAREAQREMTPFDELLPAREEETGDEEHLRSAREVVGYEVEAEGSRVGRVADLWLDGAQWRVAHLALREGGRLNLGRRAAVPASLVSAISWGPRRVELAARCERLGESIVLKPRAMLPSMLPRPRASVRRASSTWAHG